MSKIIPQGQLVPHFLMMRDGRTIPLVTEMHSNSKDNDEYLENVYDMITTRVEYVPDIKQFGMLEFVQMPWETLTNGAGDCEDTSLNFVNMASLVGIPSRMAMGYGQGESHRWAEALYKGQWYVFETTNKKAGYFPISEYQKKGYDPLFYVTPNMFMFAKFPIPPLIFP